MMGGNSDGGATGDGTCGSGKSCDDNATGGDGCGVIFGKGGMSHGRGMESSDEGPICLFTSGWNGSNGISSGIGDLFHGVGMTGVAPLCGSDGVSDGGNSMLTGSGVSSIGTGGSYCSIDKYCRRCDPQGTKGSGGDAAWGDSMIGGLG